MPPPPNLRAAVPGLRRTLQRFAPYIREQRVFIAGGSAALFVEVVLRLLEPWPLKFVFDRIIGTGSVLFGTACIHESRRRRERASDQLSDRRSASS